MSSRIRAPWALVLGLVLTSTACLDRAKPFDDDYTSCWEKDGTKPAGYALGPGYACQTAPVEDDWLVDAITAPDIGLTGAEFDSAVVAAIGHLNLADADVDLDRAFHATRAPTTIADKDGLNDIYVLDMARSGEAGTADGDSLATAYQWVEAEDFDEDLDGDGRYGESTGEVSECDIVVWAFYDDPDDADEIADDAIPFSTGTGTSTYNLPAVLAHELGHCVGLEHPSDPATHAASIMMNTSKYDSLSATVYSADEDALRWVYGDPD